jgi:hypothetical protein
MADDHDLKALEVEPGFLEQFDRSGGRARREV